MIPERIPQSPQLRHPVADREDARLRSDRGDDIGDGRGDSITADRHDHQVESGVDAVGPHGPYGCRADVSADITDTESRCGKAFPCPFPDQDGDVASAGRQQVGEVATGGAGPDDQGPHQAG